MRQAVGRFWARKPVCARSVGPYSRCWRLLALKDVGRNEPSLLGFGWYGPRPDANSGETDMYPVAMRGLTVLFATVMTVALTAAALPAQAAGPAGAGPVATTVKQLNATLHANTVTDVRRRGRGYRGRSFRGRSYGRLRHGHVRSYRRGYVRGYSRGHRYYSHRRYRRYYRPRIYYSVPYVFGYSYSSRCYKPCRYSGYSRSYCRRYCSRHRYW